MLSLLIKGLNSSSLNIRHPDEVFVLFNTQNKVQTVEDFVWKLYIISKFLIVDSSRFKYPQKDKYEIELRKLKSDF